MAFDRFLIAPYNEKSGLRTDVKPWLIPDQAFSLLQNAYVFRGRVRKRFGVQWMGNMTSLESRLRILMGSTDGSGDLALNVRTVNADAGMPTGIGQAFSVGTVTFTVYNPAAGPQQMRRSDGSAAPATYDLTTSAFNITAAPAGTNVYFYPGFPVMGLQSYDLQASIDQAIVGFDTRYAYAYNSGWDRLATEVTPGAAVWTGSDTNFFWTANYSGAQPNDRVLFVTNFNQNEPNFMRFFFNNQWDNFEPQINATPTYLICARILVPFKNRLLAFNTWEGPNIAGAVNYVNRMRFSAIGSPFAVNAWREDIPGNGNGLDAPTNEAITTVEFVRDRLVVFFEDSTWELVFTGNQVNPFAWQQINTELGAESTFSVVPFDKVALTVGNFGIHACNAANVERIDNSIPDLIFDIHNVDGGVERVYGIRDFFTELVYWTLPDTSATTPDPYPNQVLCYNYRTATWAIFDDSITAFGYYQPNPADQTLWSSQTVTWSSPLLWGSGESSAIFKQVVGGNQQGYTFICDSDQTFNDSVIQITDLNVSAGPNLVNITSINHNFRDGDYIYIEGVTQIGAGNLTLLNGKIFLIEDTPLTPLSANTFGFVYNDGVNTLAGTYSGGGIIARVSKITINTREYNFYADKGRNAYVSKVDFMVDSTQYGQIQVDYFVSTSLVPLLQDSIATGAIIGTGTLDTFPYPTVPFELVASRLWHPVYFQADGEVIQLQLTFNDAQMRDNNIRQADFQLHAMCIYAQPTSYRFQ